MDRAKVVERAKERYKSQEHGPGVEGVLEAAGYFEILEAANSILECIDEEVDCVLCENKLREALRKAGVGDE